MKAVKEFKDIELCKEEDAYSESQAKFATLKTIKLFGHNEVVSSPLEYSDGTKESVVSKCSQANASSLELVSSLVSQIDFIGRGSMKMNGSKGISSCTGSNGNSFCGAEYAGTSQDSVDSKIEFNHRLGHCLNSCKSFVSDREAVFQDGREHQRIRVYL